MIGLSAALLAAASVAGLTYGDALLDMMHRRHPELIGAQITAHAGAQLITAQRRWGQRSGNNETRVLRDANGNDIGTVELRSLCSSGLIADGVAIELSRRIYTAASIGDPDPFVAPARPAPTAQAMVDDALDRDPTIITLAFHVTPPGEAVNSIVASSFGRIGKVADADDLRIIRENKIVQEATNNGKRLAVELPLLDSHNRVIGALSTSFRMEPGVTADQVQNRAIALRNLLSRRTPSIKALFRPVTASRQVGTLRPCRA